MVLDFFRYNKVMFFEFFLWWYTQGWAQAGKNGLNWSKNIQRMFSVTVLLKTLFAPWKRIIAPPGRSMDEKMRGLVDNLTSRLVGFFVRCGVLFVSIILTVLSLLAGLLVVVIWPALPALVVYFIYRGVAG